VTVGHYAIAGTDPSIGPSSVQLHAEQTSVSPL
jgi:hypothetical protein